jgi:hypothetical protein
MHSAVSTRERERQFGVYDHTFLLLEGRHKRYVSNCLFPLKVLASKVVKKKFYNERKRGRHFDIYATRIVSMLTFGKTKKYLLIDYNFQLCTAIYRLPCKTNNLSCGYWHFFLWEMPSSASVLLGFDRYTLSEQYYGVVTSEIRRTLLFDIGKNMRGWFLHRKRQGQHISECSCIGLIKISSEP